MGLNYCCGADILDRLIVIRDENGEREPVYFLTNAYAGKVLAFNQSYVSNSVNFVSTENYPPQIKPDRPMAEMIRSLASEHAGTWTGDDDAPLLSLESQCGLDCFHISLRLGPWTSQAPLVERVEQLWGTMQSISIRERIQEPIETEASLEREIDLYDHVVTLTDRDLVHTPAACLINTHFNNITVYNESVFALKNKVRVAEISGSQISVSSIPALIRRLQKVHHLPCTWTPHHGKWILCFSVTEDGVKYSAMVEVRSIY